jgi:(S)-2-hydroxy-acid oxidase
VDGVVLGRRLNESRNSFSMPEGITYPNIESKVDALALAGADDSLHYGTTPTNQNDCKRLMLEKDTDVDWSNVIPWLKSNTRLPV